MTSLSYPHGVRVSAEVTIRLAQDTDAESISTWLRAPEVHRFWGGQPLDVEEVLAKYTGRRAPGVVSYVISESGAPVGYVQACQQDGRFGLDMFMAVESQGRGVGPRVARALAEELTTAGWTPLTVDPAVDNLRAVRAWRTAGFRETGELGMDDGITTQVMTFQLRQGDRSPVRAGDRQCECQLGEHLVQQR